MACLAKNHYYPSVHKCAMLHAFEKSALTVAESDWPDLHGSAKNPSNGEAEPPLHEQCTLQNG
jgi:hypothetical protein